MNPTLAFDFLVDKEKNTLTFRREFAGERPQVWDCFTKSELLDQWFSPKPLTTLTKHMDFREGGYWHYGMVEPNGTTHWGRMNYLTIQPMDFYTNIDAFANAEGEITSEFPSSEWRVTFIDKDENTLVKILASYKSLADLEAILQTGMKEGMISCFEKLDELLATLRKSN